MLPLLYLEEQVVQVVVLVKERMLYIMVEFLHKGIHIGTVQVMLRVVHLVMVI
jgi:hypothetical protein